VDDAAAQPEWLRDEMESWKHEAVAGTVGWSLAEPNEAWSPDQIAAVLGLTRIALARLADREWFTADELSGWHLDGERVASGVIWSVAADLVRQVGDAFARLLDGTFPPDPPFAVAFVGTPKGLRWIQGRGASADELGIEEQEWKRVWREVNDAHEAAGGSHWQRAPPLAHEPDSESSSA
jgi:hypothetical protein